MVKTLALEWHGYTDRALANARAVHQNYDPVYDEEREFDVKEIKSLADVAGTRALDPSTVQDLARGSESTKVTVLIFSLPNLRVLSMQPPYRAGLFDSRFARLATDDESSANLKEIDRIRYNKEGYFEPYSLLPALRIPSLTTLIRFSASCGDDDDGDDDEDLRAGTSNVTYLALEHSNVNGRELSRILRIPKGLRYFRFSDGGSYVRKYTRSYIPCSREGFGRALACTARTLEYLSIEWEADPEDDNSTLGSLQDFEKLHVLSIEFDVLLRVDSHAAVGLASVLPQTTEQLFLLGGQNGSWTEVEYLRSIERLIRAKSGSSIPALNFIGLQPGQNF